MAKPNTRQIDRDIRQTMRKLEAVRNGETWPLNGAERRAALTALAGGSYRVLRGKSPARAEHRLESVSSAAETRLTAELAALHIERRRIISEAAAAKKSRWW
jgi:hypothetical protein